MVVAIAKPPALTFRVPPEETVAPSSDDVREVEPVTFTGSTVNTCGVLWEPTCEPVMNVPPDETAVYSVITTV